MSCIANANVAEIEVTPEMIEAGLEVLGWFDPAEDAGEKRREIVSEIYEVMARLKCDHQKLSSDISPARASKPVVLG